METYVNDEGTQIQAQQLTGDSLTVISVWCGAQVVREHDALDYDMTFLALTVPTPDGPMRASQGDYVVQHADGSFGVQKAYQFRSEYRKV